MKEVKTYIGHYGFTIAPGAAAVTPRWDIDNMTRRFFVRSVKWDLWVRTNNVPIQEIPLEDCAVLDYWLAFGQPGIIGAQIGFAFNTGVAPGPSATDRRISFHKPGQYFFDGIYFQNSISFYQAFTSFDLVNTLSIVTNLVVEIQEEELNP